MCVVVLKRNAWNLGFAVRLVVSLRGFVLVMLGMKMVRMGKMGMVGCLFMVPCHVVLCSFLMMLGGMFVMLGGLGVMPVMLMLGHRKTPLCVDMLTDHSNAG